MARHALTVTRAESRHLRGWPVHRPTD